jgi:hypothetical protein
MAPPREVIEMVRPNFFIVGAPKSATTAISQYLRMHPNVFMSVPKEPYYFSVDIGPSPFAENIEEYLDLFAPATSEQFIVAEASASYLMSDVACEKIHQFNPDAKILVMLRNPVDLVRAWHSEMLYAGEESVADFETAWFLQESRLRGENLPPLSTRPLLLQYKKVRLLGCTLKRYLDLFGHSNVMWIVYDDFRNDPQHEYTRLLEFLGLPLIVPEQFPVVNASKKLRFKLPGQLLRYMRQKYRHQINAGMRNLGLRRTGIMELVDRINTRNAGTAAIPDQLRKALKSEFTGDVQLLESLIDRDLSHWYR